MECRDVMAVVEELGRAFLDLDDPWHWSYFLAFLLIGGAVLLARGGTRGLIQRLLPKRIWSQRSARNDIAIAVGNRVLGIVVFAPLVVFAVQLGGATERALSWAFGAPGLIAPSGLALLGFGVFDLLLSDAALFITHWMGHRIGPLWAFHKVHHSATVLTPFTAERFHPLESLQDALTIEITVGLTAGVAGWLSGGALHPIGILAVNGLNLAWNITGAHLRHSHIALHYPRWLSHILISPVMHQIHHSAAPEHHDSNLGVVFAFWDWAAGTLHIPKRGESLAFGLGPLGAGHETLAGLITQPFVDLLRTLCRADDPNP